MLPEAGTQYYVSTTGSDGADGLSRATAFRTVAKAYATMTSGDAVLLLPGTYIHNPDPYVPLIPPAGTITQGCGIDVTIIRASPAFQRPVVRPTSSCRFVDLTIDCDDTAGSFAVGGSSADVGSFVDVLFERVKISRGADVIVSLDQDNFRSMRFEDCEVEATWDGVSLFDTPCDVEFYRCTLHSTVNAAQNSARMLFIVSTGARMRVRCFDCVVFGFTASPNTSSKADPIWILGENAEVHLVDSSVLSAAPNGAQAVDLTVNSGNLTVSNNTLFNVAKVAGTILYAPTDFEAAGLIEAGLTTQQANRLISSFAAGKLSGVGTGTLDYRNAVDGSKVRMQVTVDTSGNRTAIDYILT